MTSDRDWLAGQVRVRWSPVLIKERLKRDLCVWKPSKHMHSRVDTLLRTWNVCSVPLEWWEDIWTGSQGLLHIVVWGLCQQLNQWVVHWVPLCRGWPTCGGHLEVPTSGAWMVRVSPHMRASQSLVPSWGPLILPISSPEADFLLRQGQHLEYWWCEPPMSVTT